MTFTGIGGTGLAASSLWLASLRLADSARGLDEGLTRALERIVDLEALLAPAKTRFGHGLARPGQTTAAVAGEVRKHWGNALPNLDGAQWLEFFRREELLTRLVVLPVNAAVARDFDRLRQVKALRKIEDVSRSMRMVPGCSPFRRLAGYGK